MEDKITVELKDQIIEAVQQHVTNEFSKKARKFNLDGGPSVNWDEYKPVIGAYGLLIKLDRVDLSNSKAKYTITAGGLTAHITHVVTASNPERRGSERYVDEVYDADKAMDGQEIRPLKYTTDVSAFATLHLDTMAFVVDELNLTDMKQVL